MNETPVYLVNAPAQQERSALQNLATIAVLGGVGYWIWKEFLSEKKELTTTVYETVNTPNNR